MNVTNVLFSFDKLNCKKIRISTKLDCINNKPMIKLSFKTHYAACYYNKKHSDIRLVLGQHLKSVKAKMSQNLSTSKTKSIYIMSKSTYIICNNVTLLNYAHIKQQ